MRQAIWTAAILLAGAAAHAQEKGVAWRGDYDAALKEARKDKKYVVLHFSGSN